MFYALLLLSEDYFAGAVLLLKGGAITLLYILTLSLLLNYRAADFRPVGVVLACVLAYIGFQNWRESDDYGSPRDSGHFLLFVLCLPLLIAGAVYFLSRPRQASRKKLLLTGAPLTAAELDTVQALLAKSGIEVQVRISQDLGEVVQLALKDLKPVILRPGALVSTSVRQVYNEFQPPLSEALRPHRIGAISFEKTFREEPGRSFRLYLVTTAEQFDSSLQQLDAIPRQQLFSATANGFVMIRPEENGQLTVQDIGGLLAYGAVGTNWFVS